MKWINTIKQEKWKIPFITSGRVYPETYEALDDIKEKMKVRSKLIGYDSTYKEISSKFEKRVDESAEDFEHRKDYFGK